MGSDGLQVVLDQLDAMAGQWQGLGAQLTRTTPPPPGQPFQATTATVGSINAMVSADAAALAARTQDTATGMSTAGVKYASQETSNASDMSNVPKVTVV